MRPSAADVTKLSAVLTSKICLVQTVHEPASGQRHGVAGGGDEQGICLVVSVVNGSDIRELATRLTAAAVTSCQWR